MTANGATRTTFRRSRSNRTARSDWYTYVGFTRYSSECLRCHGPDGMGSSYAPALMESMKRLSYTDFYAVVASGKKDVSASQNLVMPANGENKNVMCFIDAIYVYLRARADDAVGRGRPEKHAPKPEAFTKAAGRMHGLTAIGRVMIGRMRVGRRLRSWSAADRRPRRRPGSRSRRIRGTGRPEDVPGLRRPAQPAVLQRSGRRVREQAGRTVRAQTRRACQLHLLSRR